MAAPIKPQKKTANGKDSWWFVPAVADQDSPSALEVNAAAGLNVSCFLLAEQEGVTATTSKVALARLLCETSTTEGLDTTTWGMSDIQGVFDPQAAAASDGKKAWDLFKDGFTGFAIRRQGVAADVDSAVTVGEFVDVIPVDVAPATPGKTSNDSSGIYSFSAAVAVTGTPSFNVAVAA